MEIECKSHAVTHACSCAIVSEEVRIFRCCWSILETSLNLRPNSSGASIPGFSLKNFSNASFSSDWDSAIFFISPVSVVDVVCSTGSPNAVFSEPNYLALYIPGWHNCISVNILPFTMPGLNNDCIFGAARSRRRRSLSLIPQLVIELRINDFWPKLPRQDVTAYAWHKILRLVTHLLFLLLSQCARAQSFVRHI